MGELKPIPTRYREVLFRSRLEARWAVFFGGIGVRWLYEHEGYDLGGVWYLPDFWLPEPRLWVEIKPHVPTRTERLKCEALARHAGDRGAVRLVYGSPTQVVRDLWEDDVTTGVYGINDFPDCYLPCICPHCGAFSFEFEGRGARACRKSCDPGSDRNHTSSHPRLVEAAQRADAYRFDQRQR